MKLAEFIYWLYLVANSAALIVLCIVWVKRLLRSRSGMRYQIDQIREEMNEIKWMLTNKSKDDQEKPRFFDPNKD